MSRIGEANHRLSNLEAAAPGARPALLPDGINDLGIL